MNAQPMVWSVRRELWENRSIYLAPLAVAAVIVFASLVGMLGHGAARDPDKIAQPYNLAALILMGTTFIVAVFYCIDALHGERRDRSILFWKSLPVSDLTTVLSKFAIPIVVLPLLTFVITVATQLIMLMLRSALLIASGQSAAALWTLPWPEMSGMLLWHLVAVHGLYYAPIFAWLLLVSAWARRMPLLWAVLPPIAISILEKIAFNTNHFSALLGSRISGGEEGKAASRGATMLGHFMPGEFLSKPGLWIGFALAAIFLAAAVRLRRYRGPV